MNFTVEDSVLELFPKITFGVLVGKIEQEKQNISEKIKDMRANSLEHVRDTVGDMILTKHPNFGGWRETYRIFGVKAKSYKPTHEALVRRLLKDASWPDINNIVDIYLANQALHMLPHGGYDLQTLGDNMVLSRAKGDEIFEPLGGGEESPRPGEIIYYDENRILTRRWNYRDCDATKITSTTKEFILMIEAASDQISDDLVDKAIKDLAGHYKECYEGNFETSLLIANNSEYSFNI